jgi:hypothetical protein
MTAAHNAVTINPTATVRLSPIYGINADPLKADAIILGRVDINVSRPISNSPAPIDLAYTVVNPNTVAKVINCDNTANPDTLSKPILLPNFSN